MKKRTMLPAVALLLIAGMAASSAAVAGDDSKDASGKEYRLVSDRFNVTAGTYLADLNTEAAVGIAGLAGSFIRLEDDLAIEQYQTTFRLSGFWRLGSTGRNAITFGYVGIDRQGSRVLEEEIEFQGITYRADGTLASDFNVKTFSLGYRYSFVNTGRTEAGFTAGISAYDFSLALAGEIEVTQPGRQIYESAAASEDILAPLPTVGMFVNYGITERLILRLHAAFLSLNVDDYSGRVTDSGFSLEYYFLRNFGVGFGAATTDIQVDKTGEDPWSVGYRQGGFTFYLTGVF